MSETSRLIDRPWKDSTGPAVKAGLLSSSDLKTTAT